MRGSIQARGWRIGLAIALGVVRAASAAPAVIPASGVEFEDAELFRPTVDPGSFLSVYDTRVLSPGRFSVGSYLSASIEPLDARRRIAGEEENEKILDSALVFDLVGALGLARSLQLGAHLPLYVTDESDVILGAEPRGDTNVNFGDLLVNAKFSLLRSEGGFGLALLPTLGLPTGNRREFAGLGRFSYGGLLAADYSVDRWSFGANFGGAIRDRFGGRDEDDDFEDVFRWGVAVSRSLGDRGAWIAELFGASDGSEEFHSPVEILGAIRWNVGAVDLTFGIGGGLNSGKNAALLRFLVGVTAPLERPSAPRERAFAGPPQMAGSRKTYVVEDHDRNGQVSPGDVIVYTITLVNSGVEPARNVIVVDPIPADTEFVPGTIVANGLPVADFSGFTPAPPQVVVRLASVGGSGAGPATISFKARIRPNLDTPTTIRNDTRVSADGLGTFGLPPVETAVFPASGQREKVVQTPSTPGPRKLEVTENIQFEPAGSTLRPESYPVLDQVASLLQEDPRLRLRIVGHTDDVGDEAANLQLSEWRARAVKDYLVSRGIDPQRLETLGRGEYEPVASNLTEAGRAANRRVEFIVIP
jgi:uncharacterized repeat protein (TIGR01451 family)